MVWVQMMYCSYPLYRPILTNNITFQIYWTSYFK
jgi:hypothetical protein